MKALFVAALLGLAASPSSAEPDLMQVPSAQDVASTMDALQAAVTGAGATVFARVDHAGGARGVGMDLADSQLLIFGNPKLGTPAMQADPLAGLFLPLKVLVYADGDGQVWLAYEDPGDMFADLDVPADAEVVKMMTGALGKLTAAAAGG
ncbi:DUF302 domain-containing protein [Actibacterium ureilyticum]|uniref:DUF302 domain-containing protein n=1 Tax=Actibacterium ureilyticum TaxID=1590614 RepID=UPI000BAB1962|nr:DUF302 domain-containing protein [Actibacterium ureilyticum]